MAVPPLDPATGALRAWNPGTDWGIYAIVPAPDGSGIFVGGPYSRIGGVARPYLAKVNATSGALTSWTSANRCNDETNRVSRSLAWSTDSSTVYVAAGGPGGRLYALSVSSGNQRWTAGTDGDFQAIAISGDSIFGGGHFTDRVSGVSRAGFVGLDRATGRVLADPSVRITGDMGVWSLLVDGNRLRVGGEFNRVGNASIGRYTTFVLR